jgi:hypothetical protein
MVNIKPIIAIIIAAIGIGIVLYRYNKKSKAIMGQFAALLIIFWEEVKEKFGG